MDSLRLFTLSIAIFVLSCYVYSSCVVIFSISCRVQCCNILSNLLSVVMPYSVLFVTCSVAIVGLSSPYFLIHNSPRTHFLLYFRIFNKSISQLFLFHLLSRHENFNFNFCSDLLYLGSMLVADICEVKLIQDPWVRYTTSWRVRLSHHGDRPCLKIFLGLGN